MEEGHGQSNRLGEWRLQQLSVRTERGKLHLLKLGKRIWQWLESETIKLDQWVFGMTLEYLRLVWKKRVYCSRSTGFGSPAWLNQTYECFAWQEYYKTAKADLLFFCNTFQLGCIYYRKEILFNIWEKNRAGLWREMKYLVVGGGCMFGLFQYHTNQKSRGVVLGVFIVGFFFFPPREIYYGCRWDFGVKRFQELAHVTL